MTAIGIISIDNYDDVIDKLDDKESSYLNTMITSIISDWASEHQIFYKRINAERHFFVASEADIEKMKSQKFNILSNFKDQAHKRDLLLTMSMGIAYGEGSLKLIGEIAQDNLDLALIRGGDQVVIKDDQLSSKPIFFGGNSDGTIKRTRVRSKAMSTALKRVMLENEQIFIMGHRFPDMDAFGASFGIASLAKMVHKKCWIILNREEITPELQRCIDELKQYPELESLLISDTEALSKLNEKSVLVMVDYHRPSMSISQAVYDAFEKIVVIDHHRRGEEYPNKPLLNYIEASASSASELVAELLEYQTSAEIRLAKFVATMMLAGMYVDTKNFTFRSSSRTFDIASYLKAQGADATQVQYLLSSDLDSYLEMSQLISTSQYIAPKIVCAVGLDNRIYGRVTTAKAADTLVSMAGVEAAFVITKQDKEIIGISARSMGNVNVQKIMEALEGGGHFTNAATKIKGQSLEKVRKMLFNEVEKLELI